jgi:CTP-dependent riboflavin kinase
MIQKTLKGRISSGLGDARSWEISGIRKATGYDRLKEGTLNVRLDAPHRLRRDYALRREHRKDRREHDEDLYFERCVLVIGTDRVQALIARTSTNYWGPSILEIMAEEMIRDRYGLQDGDALEVEVWVEAVP